MHDVFFKTSKKLCESTKCHIGPTTVSFINAEIINAENKIVLTD